MVYKNNHLQLRQRRLKGRALHEFLIVRFLSSEYAVCLGGITFLAVLVIHPHPPTPATLFPRVLALIGFDICIILG